MKDQTYTDSSSPCFTDIYLLLALLAQRVYTATNLSKEI
jgi:hypothetical protein